MNFLDIEINEKIFKNLIVAGIVFVIVYLAITMSSLLILRSYTLGATTTVNDENIKTHIDVLEVSSKKIEIAGYAYKENEEIRTVNSNYVIKHQESGKMYMMKTKMVENKNVEDEMYTLGGLHAQSLLVGVPKGQYQIFVLYKNNNEDILADTLITFEVK